MTETRKTEAELLADLPVGGTREISAQDVRDGFYSVLRPDVLYFQDQTSEPAHVEGAVHYGSGTWNFARSIAGVTANFPEEQQTPLARNTSGGTLANGTAVYVSGATGNKPTLGRASNADATAQSMLGLATHDIANNGYGYATTFGLVHDLDTSAWTEGTELFLGVDGALTSTRPAIPAFVVSVGYVIYQHSSNGIVFVSIRRIPRASDGWVDILGTVFYPTTGPSAPARTALSSPHGNFGFPKFAIGDLLQWEGHIPHLIDPSEGVYMHVHMLVDGVQTDTVKFDLEWTYAHGYSRQALTSPQTVSVEQAGAGTAKTHQVLEIASPILVDAVETDGLLSCVCKRVTNGVSDVTNNVFVRFFDAHCKLLNGSSTNRNYPFE